MNTACEHFKIGECQERANSPWSSGRIGTQLSCFAHPLNDCFDKLSVKLTGSVLNPCPGLDLSLCAGKNISSLVLLLDSFPSFFLILLVSAFHIFPISLSTQKSETNNQNACRPCHHRLGLGRRQQCAVPKRLQGILLPGHASR